MKSLDLTQQERAFVKAIEDRFSEGPGYHPTLEQMLNAWESFATEIEQGYIGTIDDYTNDLWTRDLLQEFLDRAPEELRHKLVAWMHPINARFESATRPDTKNAIAKFFKPGNGWWWSRIPVKLGDLAIDLEGLY